MEQQPPSSQTGQQQQVPREAKLVSLLLSSSGVSECEPKVIQQLIEFMYRMGLASGLEKLPNSNLHLLALGYVTDVLQDSLVYSEHAGKSEIDLEDLRLAIRNQLKHMFVPPPSRDLLLELAARKNAQPLPPFDDAAMLKLPPDHNTLMGTSYRITSQRKPVKPIQMTGHHPSGGGTAGNESDAAMAMHAMMGADDTSRQQHKHR